MPAASREVTCTVLAGTKGDSALDASLPRGSLRRDHHRGAALAVSSYRPVAAVEHRAQQSTPRSPSARVASDQQHRGAARALQHLLEVLLGHRDGVRRSGTRPTTRPAGACWATPGLQSGQIHRTGSGEGFLGHADILYDTPGRG